MVVVSGKSPTTASTGTKASMVLVLVARTTVIPLLKAKQKGGANWRDGQRTLGKAPGA